jgi:hypothetical protein
LIEILDFEIQVVGKLLETKQMGRSNLQTIETLSGNLTNFGLSNSNGKGILGFKKIDMGSPKFANPKLQVET